MRWVVKIDLLRLLSHTDLCRPVWFLKKNIGFQKLPCKTPCWNELWLPMWMSAEICASHAYPTHTGTGLCTMTALNTYLWSPQFGNNRWYLLRWDLKIQPLKSRVPTWEERDAGCSWWCAGISFRSFSFLNPKENTLLDSTQKLTDQAGCPMEFPWRKKKVGIRANSGWKIASRQCPKWTWMWVKSENEIK